MKRKRILICGSTGSIGTQTLEIIREHSSDFVVCGLTAEKNQQKLLQQIDCFDPKAVYIQDKKAHQRILSQNTGKDFKLYTNQEELIRNTTADIVVMAVVGEAGIPLVRAALETGKDVALATKEVIVAAGKEIQALAQKYNRQILPIDSEHSAIWQSLRAGKKSEVTKIWLTCSGGPFYDPIKWPLKKLQKASVEEALRHPKWEMGKKISIDSATLMNKALEVIEAAFLFDIPEQQIEVVIHPESQLHSAVEFQDGSVIAQIGTADMRTAIAYALYYPERPILAFPKFSFFEQQWNFARVDHTRFPSILFARRALHLGYEAEFNRANEKAVQAFLDKKITFGEIFTHVEAIFDT